MRKLVLLFFIIFFLNSVLAIEINMNNGLYSGETLFATFSGNFIKAPQESNVFLYRGHVRVPFDFQLAKVGSEYWISGTFESKLSQNYTLLVEDVEYYSGNNVIDLNLEKNFTILNKTAPFSISPKFIVANNSFSVKIRNFQDTTLEVFVSDRSSNELEVGPNKEETFDFDVSDYGDEIRDLRFSSSNYSSTLKIYTGSGKDSSSWNSTKIEFDPSEISIPITINSSNLTRYLYLKNTGYFDVENINLSISDSLKDYVSLDNLYVEDIGRNSSVKLNLNIIPSGEEGNIAGQIKAKSGEAYAYLFVEINFTKNFIPAQDNEFLGNESEETSSNSNTNSSSISWGKILGWILLIGIIGFLVWFFLKKYRKTKRDIDLVETGKKGSSQRGKFNRFLDKPKQSKN